MMVECYYYGKKTECPLQCNASMTGFSLTICNVHRVKVAQRRLIGFGGSLLSEVPHFLSILRQEVIKLALEFIYAVISN